MPHREYYKIPPSDFANETVLKVDLYYQVSPTRFQKIGLKGSPFCESHIPIPLRKNLQWLFLKKEDFEIHVDLNLGQSTPTALSQDEIEKKFEEIQKGTGNLIQHFIQSGLKSKNIETVSTTVSQMLKLVLQNPVTLKLFEGLHAIEKENFHSVAVSFWSLLIARRMGWTGEPFLFQVALCALFHDVGFRENLTPLLDKNPSDLTAQETQILESHTLRGRDILNSIHGMPATVATVALQHHETLRGTGYPSRLKGDEIHPLSRLISVANRFCELEWMHRKQKISFQDIFSILKKEREDFDSTCFKSLEDVIFSRV